MNEMKNSCCCGGSKNKSKEHSTHAQPQKHEIHAKDKEVNKNKDKKLSESGRCSN